MGCGASKHQVATEKTITKIKSRKSSKSADGSIKTTKVAETISQNDQNPSTPLKQQQQEESKIPSLHEQQRQEGDQEREKEEEQSKKPTEENSEAQNADENSANNKLELDCNAETVEAIISDGISGKTEYYSPRSYNYEVGFGKFGDQESDGEKSLVDQEETKVERETQTGAGDPGEVNEAESEALATSTVQERNVNDNKESAF